MSTTDKATSIESPHRVIHATIAFLFASGFSKEEIESAFTDCLINNVQPPEKPLVRTDQNFHDLGRLFREWQCDPDYLDEHGEPRPLPIAGSRSIVSLLEKSGVEPANQLIQFAISYGYISATPLGYLPSGRDLGVPAGGPVKLWCDLTVASRALQTLAFNAQCTGKDQETNFQRYAQQLQLKRSHLPLFRQFIRDQGEAFLETIDDWMNLHQAVGDDAITTEVSVHTFAWTSDSISESK